MDIGRLVEWIKLSPGHLVPLSLFTGFLLFAPERWLAVFGLVGFVSQWRPYFGAVFLLSTALLLGAALVSAWGMVKQKRTEAAFLRGRWERLHHLSEPEKEILRGYIEAQTRTQYLSMADGVVGGLGAERIIYRASSLGQSFDYFAYNIHPWAWEYLNAHPKLLS
jgi:Super-infection exclusion protein B